MIIDCISDLHGHYPELEGGDLLIVAGDMTRSDSEYEWDKFDSWLESQDYEKKIFIAGNHDNALIKENPRKYFRGTPKNKVERFEYLCDSGTKFEGLKIWGSPWSLAFLGINPHCAAFTGTEADLKAKFDLIPEDVDILITHGPPHGIRDYVENYMDGQIECVGSIELIKAVERVRPQFHIVGHIHEGYGKYERNETLFINCSYVNEFYEPVNEPIRVIL